MDKCPKWISVKGLFGGTFRGTFDTEMSRKNVRGKLSGTGAQIRMQDYKSL